jgi:hypothetical protein
MRLGSGPALKVADKGLDPRRFNSLGFSLAPVRARRSEGSPFPNAGFEERRIPSAGKIERPTAVRTVFERPVG